MPFPNPLHLGQSAEFSRKIYERISQIGKIGIWECDLATEELMWTSAVYTLFDLPNGAVLDRGETLECYEPSSRQEMIAKRAHAIATCSTFTVDAAIRTKANNLRWIRITGDVEQENGKPVRIFGTKQDITEEKEAQLQLQALQSQHLDLSRSNAINAMGSTLAHELNQPLAAIAMYGAALRRMFEKGATALELDEILEGMERCTLKSGEILRAIRRTSVSARRYAVAFDLNGEIAEACRIALAGAHSGLSVRFAMHDGLLGFGDPVQIQQVVINLIRNACEAMAESEHREIVISTVEIDGQAEVSVRDTGSGIPMSLIDQIFEPFVSARPSGTGIGLAISRTIVEAHSGKLRGANNVDGGATFYFNIPIADNGVAGTMSEKFARSG